jgi:hypothetical protein
MTRTPKKLSDAEAKAILKLWPESTGELWRAPQGDGRWLRAQPATSGPTAPRISSPGAKLFKTQPDGLFVYFNDTESCDLVCIEACGSSQNLNDKRSRYMPSIGSLVLSAKAKWLQAQMPSGPGRGVAERWVVAGSIRDRPTADMAIPVRNVRVLYSLPNELYRKWKSEHSPTGYEYFCRNSSLASYSGPAFQSFLRRMSIASQFYTKG